MNKKNLILGGIIAVLVMGNIYFVVERDFYREEYNQTIDEHNRQIEEVFNWEEENLEKNKSNISEIDRCEELNHELTEDYNNLLNDLNNIGDVAEKDEKNYNNLYTEHIKCVDDYNNLLVREEECVGNYSKVIKDYTELYTEYEKTFQ